MVSDTEKTSHFKVMRDTASVCHGLAVLLVRPPYNLQSLDAISQLLLHKRSDRTCLLCLLKISRVIRLPNPSTA